MAKRTGGTLKHQAFLCVEVRFQLIAKYMVPAGKITNTMF